MFVTVFISFCSREVATYDELVQRGETESIVRKKYNGFFKAISRLAVLQESTENTPSDSTIFKKAAAATDDVIAEIRRYPETVDSRLAFDALSYAAHDLSILDNFSQNTVSFFWENALLDPLLTKGREYIKSEVPNESTHLQIVKALQRGMGEKATGDMLLDIIPIIGPNPSEKVMDVCMTDSLALRKIHDLIIYTRSLQKYGPPLWMTTGVWLLVIETDGWPLTFFSLKPIIVDKALYLIFRDYNLGTVYSSAFDDPIPDNSEKNDAWLARAGAVMGSLKIDEEIAERFSSCELPTYDAHNFYNDYLLYIEADSVKKEFTIILKRERIRENAFEFIGIDSISVLFSTKHLDSSDGPVTRLAATRVQGPSMIGGRLLTGRKGEGTAYILPMGTHNTEMLNEIRDASMPEIKINTR